MTDPTTYVRCPDCKGSGAYDNVSNCCGTSAHRDITPPSDICSCCGEHCEYLETKCPTCDGLGEVTPAQAKAYQESLKEYEPENKYK